MKLPVTTYFVLMHHQDVGTFAPAFSNIEDAEDFSNAMRLVTDGVVVSEPLPMTAGKPINTPSFL